LTSESITSIIGSGLLSFSGAGLIGFLIGYGTKKVLKLIAIILGGLLAIVMVPMAYLASKGIITVNYDKLTVLLESWGNSALFAATSSVSALTISLPITGGLAAGFAYGLKKG
jgi:uncharacterized membrane protein (Fun14 family)